MAARQRRRSAREFGARSIAYIANRNQGQRWIVCRDAPQVILSDVLELCKAHPNDYFNLLLEYCNQLSDRVLGSIADRRVSQSIPLPRHYVKSAYVLTTRASLRLFRHENRNAVLSVVIDKLRRRRTFEVSQPSPSECERPIRKVGKIES